MLIISFILFFFFFLHFFIIFFIDFFILFFLSSTLFFIHRFSLILNFLSPLFFLLSFCSLNFILTNLFLKILIPISLSPLRFYLIFKLEIFLIIKKNLLYLKLTQHLNLFKNFHNHVRGLNGIIPIMRL